MFDDRRRDNDDDEDRDLEFLNRADERLPAAHDDESPAPAGEPGDFPDGDDTGDDDGPWRTTAPVTGVRRRGGRSGRGLLAVVVVALVAMLAFVFWPRGGFELPPPVGEQTSVVTTDSPGQPYDPAQSYDPGRPVSGDVDRTSVREDTRELVVIHARPVTDVAGVEMHEGRTGRRIEADAAALQAKSGCADLG